MALSMESNKLVRTERMKAIRVSRLIAELDLEGILRQNLDDCTHLAGRKPKLWNIENQCHSVEKLDGRLGRHKSWLVM